jgi:hypothetical protein
MYKTVVPECFIDTWLVNTFLQASYKKGVNHGKGVSRVVKKMEADFNDSFSIGMIDKDRRELDCIKADFSVINHKIADYAILHKHNSKPHYLIQLCPESEDWICNVSKAIGINLNTDHKMPDTPHSLGKITKKVTSNYDKRFEALFKDILNKSEQLNFEPVLKMKSWLRYLTDSKYNVDLNELMK